MAQMFQGYPHDPFKYVEAAKPAAAPIMPPTELVKYVEYSILDCGIFCGLDAIREFRIFSDSPGKERPGEVVEYNRVKRVVVRKEEWLDSVEENLIGKPGLLIFNRYRNYNGTWSPEWNAKELLDLVEADTRCTLLASYLNRTGPHREYPNHLKLFMFLGKHENPDNKAE